MNYFRPHLEKYPLPKGWSQLPLKQFILGMTSGSRPSGGSESDATGVFSLGGEHIDDHGGLRFDNMTYVPRSFFEAIREDAVVETNDTLLNKDGAKTGKVAFVDETFPFVEACINEHVFRIRADRSKVADRNLFYFLHSVLGQAQLSKYIQGSAQPGINQRFPKFLLMRVPADPGEQSRIAETLKAADNHIIALEEQIRKAERMKKALTQSAFPYERDSTGLPTINSLIVAPVTNGYSPVCPDYETGRWVLGLDALSEHGFNPEGKKPAPADDPKLAGNELLVNDILISRSNTRERVGFAGLYDGNPAPCFYPDLMMRVRVDHAKIRPLYLDLLLQSEFARRYFQSRAGGTSGSMVKIKERDVRQMPVILPDPDEQDIVVERFQTGAALIAALRNRLTAARRVKQSLLQNLLTGRIRLKA